MKMIVVFVRTGDATDLDIVEQHQAYVTVFKE